MIVINNVNISSLFPPGGGTLVVWHPADSDVTARAGALA
jgi:hypothetical protein